MRRLKTVLQCNKYLVILLLLVVLITIYRTNFLVNKSNYESINSFVGIITDFYIYDDKIILHVKNKEIILAKYYFNDNDISKEIVNNISLGDQVFIAGKETELKNNTIENTFNYKKYLNNHSIYHVMNVNKLEIKKKNTNILFSIKNYIKKEIIKKNNKEYYSSLLLGDKHLLNDEEYNLYKKNGIVHLFSVSGLHIGVLISFLSLILYRIKEKQKYLIISLFLLIFGFLVSFTASIQRIVIFFIIKGIYTILNKEYNNIKILLICASIILLINPYMLYDTGFLYSFTCVFGILYFNKRSSKNYFLNILRVSIISFVIVLPITTSLNYEVNLTSILINIFMIPYVSFILFPLAIISFIISFFSPIFDIAIIVLKNMSNFANTLAINIVIPKMPLILVITYYIIILLIRLQKRISIILPLIIIINILLPSINVYNRIVFFDVSQGDSILILSDKNIAILIDTGQSYNYINNIILFLKSNGIDSIDSLIISHGDYDHMGEAINLVNNFKVEKVIFNCGEFNDLEKELIKVLDKKKIKYYSCIKELNVDNNKLYFLQTKEYDNENDNSNVIYTEINGYKFMFMGDAGIDKEKDILEKYNISNIDILKVGHHGSKTSSSKAFINEINPNYSIISVGKNNRYGHPNKEALENLNNSKIYRTDQDGSIMFKIKNNKLKIETCSP